MKAFVVVLLLLVGCGDTTLSVCDKADMPIPPSETAYRSLSGDTLYWTWVQGEFQVTEIWRWEECHWKFDKLIKTRIDL